MKELPLRSELSAGQTWDLTPLYVNGKAWEKDFKRINLYLKKVKAFRGRLGESAETLYAAMAASDDLSRLIEKLYTFAHLRSDEDTGNSENRARVDRMIAADAEAGAATAWMEPELLAIETEKFRALLKAPALRKYRRSLKKLEEKRKHYLSEPEERLLELSGEVFSGSEKAFSMLNDADLLFPVIKDEKGEDVRISHGNYRRFLESGNRTVRKAAFDGVYSVYSQHKNTFAALLDTEVRGHLFEAKVRKYRSALESALSGDDIPCKVYHSLIDAVRNGIDPLYRYFSYRAGKLGLKKLSMYDISCPLQAEVQEDIPWDQAVAWVREALTPMGKEYGMILNKAFAERWIDIPECKGKRSGAYSGGCFDSPPYLLLNHNGSLDSVFTLIHELGHSMHSWFSNTSNDYHYASYKIFVAEVASTTNEVLLYHYLESITKDPVRKAYLRNYMIDMIRATLFRQTMFAEFERDIHDMAANGGALTADALSNRYFELNRFYHGPAVEPDDAIRYEWARIPHFHYDFYVFQYATGISAALALARKILAGDTKGYLTFLKAGDSKDVIDIMKDAGVDFTTTRPVKDAIASFGEMVDGLIAGDRQ